MDPRWVAPLAPAVALNRDDRPVNRLTDPIRIVRQAATLASIDRQWLEGWFLPLFANDSVLARAWEGNETGVEVGS